MCVTGWLMMAAACGAISQAASKGRAAHSAVGLKMAMEIPSKTVTTKAAAISLQISQRVFDPDARAVFAAVVHCNSFLRAISRRPSVVRIAPSISNPS